MKSSLISQGSSDESRKRSGEKSRKTILINCVSVSLLPFSFPQAPKFTPVKTISLTPPFKADSISR